MCDVLDINWIGESSLHKNYERLYLFYQKVWKQPHTYIVMNARRCFNLNYVFLKVHKASHKNAAHAENIISNNALLLCSDEIARFYRDHDRFPSILIVDDLVLHGRGIARLLFELEELIISKLYPSPVELTRDERYYIRRDLAAAIDIFAFAANRHPLLIEDIYTQKLQCEMHLFTRDIRSLSQQISGFLQKADVPNTSYVLSYELHAEPTAGAAWLEQHWSYRGARHRVFFLPEFSSSGVSFLPTVRLRGAYAQKSCPNIWLTGLTLFGNLSRSNLSGICKRTHMLLSAGDFPAICAILEEEHRILQKQQAQLISFILSAIYLREFLLSSSAVKLLKGGTALDPAQSDIGKIARNFGKAAVIQQELVDLIGSPGVLSNLHDALCGELQRCAAPFLEEPLREADQSLEAESVNFFMEDCLYDMGMASERSAYKVISLNRYLPNERDSGTIEMDALLHRKAPPLCWEAPKKPVESLRKLSCMLALMDNGLMAMNLECSEDGEAVGTSLKAGELATFSIPRRLHLFIPALALVEQESWRVDLEPEDAVKQFMQTLPDSIAPGKAGQTSAWRKENAALSFLKSHGGELTDLLYACGQTMNSWDIDLVTMDDWLEEKDAGSYLSFVFQESERQDYYLDLARQFLNHG